MNLSVLVSCHTGFPVYVLDVKGIDGKDRGKMLIFPKEVVTDLHENKIYIKCEAGMIPLSDLRLPTILDKDWISEAIDMARFEIREFDFRLRKEI